MDKAAKLVQRIMRDFVKLGIPEKHQIPLMAALPLGSTLGDERNREHWRTAIRWLRKGNATAVKYAEELAAIVGSMPPAPVNRTPTAPLETPVTTAMPAVHQGEPAPVSEAMPCAIRLEDIGVCDPDSLEGFDLDACRATTAGGGRRPVLHAAVLALSTGGPWRYTVVAGANLLMALSHIRGGDGMLEPHEYVLVTQLDEADWCRIASRADRKHDRSISSPLQFARYVACLAEEFGCTLDELERYLTLPREVVTALVELPKHFDRLPACWQVDLQMPTGCESTHVVAISGPHWVVAATAVAQHGCDPRLQRILCEAHDERWTVERLSQVVEAFRSVANTIKPIAGDNAIATPAIGTPIAPVPEVPPDVLFLLDPVERMLSSARRLGLTEQQQEAIAAAFAEAKRVRHDGPIHDLAVQLMAIPQDAAGACLALGSMLLNELAGSRRPA